MNAQKAGISNPSCRQSISSAGSREAAAGGPGGRGTALPEQAWEVQLPTGSRGQGPPDSCSQRFFTTKSRF